MYIVLIPSNTNPKQNNPMKTTLTAKKSLLTPAEIAQIEKDSLASGISVRQWLLAFGLRA